ncbi:MAG: hypothetical protein H7099_05575 [Gemmatimonadaceae bacterium]|nr:hypothetical protein [Gemmatimonadaceae bacterium]
MTRSLKALSAVAMLAACALPISSASAQDSAAAKIRTFDAASAVSLTGVSIIRVDTLKQGENSSVSALFVSGSDSITAMIAPVTFLSSNSLTLAAGDVIDISGSKLMMAGKSMLVATEIKKGETKVVLRDKATGAPAWPQGTAMSKP